MIKWNLDHVSLMQVRLQNDLKTWHDSKFSLSVLGPYAVVLSVASVASRVIKMFNLVLCIPTNKIKK